MIGSAAAALEQVACVILAAGGSRRLGRPKQLVRRRCRPLLTQAIRVARAALPRSAIIVVLGAEPLRLRLLLRRSARGAIAVMNPRWAEGLATSLQAGLKAVPPSTTAILFMLVDQPQIDAAAVRRLLAAWLRRPGVPAAARYDRHAGVPAVLPRRYWQDVMALRGDSGARALLRGSAVTLTDMPEAALDVDTPADVAKLR